MEFRRQNRTGAEAEDAAGETKRREVFWFVALAILIWPLIAVAIVGGYGFIVWMVQTFITGPPGPPAA